MFEPVCLERGAHSRQRPVFSLCRPFFVTETEINQAGGPVAISPADPQTILFASHDRLFRSTDGAQTSTLVLEASLTDVVFAPNAPDTAFATGEGYDIYLSVDGGATFELLANLRSDVLNP